jgi:WD40 repeat protein
MSKTDFFGDGNSDFVFQNTDGAVALWDMSGISVIGGGLVANPGPTWDVEGTAGSTAITPGSGSFTDDLGNVYTISAAGDVALVNGSPVFEGGGTAKLEYYNNTLYGQDAATGAWYRLVSDGSWAASAAPGFFADGSPGIVLQNTDGSVALWDMNGTSIVGGGLVANPGPGWEIKGTGVFSDDGSTAILFQNTDGSVALWDMSGLNVIGGGLVANPGPGWQIKGTGDFFGDGNTDIVFQSTDGSVALWDMSGTKVIGGGLVGNPGPTWHVKGTGNTDITFQNTNGSVALWDMHGLNVVGGGLVGNPGTGWNLLDNNLRFIYSASANETLAATPASPDEFVFTSFAAGSHTISGFSPVQDMIEFSKVQFPSFADVQAATSAVSGGAMINLGNGSSLLLPGVEAGSLHASNFVLA